VGKNAINLFQKCGQQKASCLGYKAVLLQTLKGSSYYLNAGN